MTQIVNPSIDRVADSFLTAGSLAYAGLKEGGIVPSGQQTELAKQSAADETVLNGFAFSTSGLDVTVSAGEAFVFGSWIIKDTQTTVTLPSSSTTKVYVGWNKNAANSVIIGPLSNFEDEDAKIEVGEFTTDSSTVTSESDLREFVSVDAERLEGKDTSEITPDILDDGATVVQNVDDINVEEFSASDDGDGSATIVGPAQYTDSDAIDAVNNESSLSVNISGDANTVDGFSFVKDGNSGPNIINYKTTIEATGGDTIIDRTIGGVDYRIHEFNNVGSSIFNVNQAPSGSTIEIFCWGGGGAGDTSFWRTPAGYGGAGGFSNGELQVSSGNSFTVITAGGGEVAPQNTYDDSNIQSGGFGGGGWTKADGGGGGGLSGVFSNTTELSFDSSGQSRALIIAGGGGGGADGVSAGSGSSVVGGAGGGLSGGTGETGQSGADGGTGGNQSSPGTNPRDSSGRTGRELHGAQPENSVSTEGGAGGGGYFGGGSGYEISGPGGAGGGGSGYIDSTMSGETLGGGLEYIPPNTSSEMYPGNNIGQGGDGDNNGNKGFVAIRYEI